MGAACAGRSSGRARLARRGRLAAALLARSWGTQLVHAPGRGSGALGAEGGPTRWPARGVGRRKVRTASEGGQREMVGGEEREERREKMKRKRKDRKEEKRKQIGSGFWVWFGF